MATTKRRQRLDTHYQRKQAAVRETAGQLTGEAMKQIADVLPALVRREVGNVLAARDEVKAQRCLDEVLAAPSKGYEGILVKNRPLHLDPPSTRPFPSSGQGTAGPTPVRPSIMAALDSEESALEHLHTAISVLEQQLSSVLGTAPGGTDAAASPSPGGMLGRVMGQMFTIRVAAERVQSLAHRLEL